MLFSLLVHGSPYTNQATHTSYRFCKATYSSGHKIKSVFFYSDAVYVASGLITPPQDEANISDLWLQLASANNFQLIICIGAALRRGILDSAEAKRYNKDVANINKGFVIAGLGQLIEATFESDRLITFGP